MPDKVYTTWESTLIKSENIKWKHKLTVKMDGKLDFDLHLPLTELFRQQAKKSFAAGMMIMMNYHIVRQVEGESITVDDLVELLNNVGLPEHAKDLKALGDKIKGEDGK
jgi:hypothetical protein